MRRAARSRPPCMSSPASTSTNGAQASASDSPNGITSAGYNEGAFDASASDREIPPLPDDGFPDYLNLAERERQVFDMMMKWYVRPSAVALVFLTVAVAILVRVNGAKPNVMPYVQTITRTIQCKDVHCTKTATNEDLSNLVPVSKNEQAQEAVARAILPQMIHQAFTISQPKQDQFDWTNYVEPFIRPNSQAANFFLTYLQQPSLVGLASKGDSTVVTVDPVGAPQSPGVYFVGWVLQVEDHNGTLNPPQRFFANVTVEWGDPTELNRDGLYVVKVESTQENGGTNS